MPQSLLDLFSIGDRPPRSFALETGFRIGHTDSFREVASSPKLKTDEAFFNIIFPIYPGYTGLVGGMKSMNWLSLIPRLQQSEPMIKMDAFGFSGLTAPIFGTDRFPGAFSSARRGPAVEFLRTI
jgi:hypothetical protein